MPHNPHNHEALVLLGLILVAVMWVLIHVVAS